MKCLLFITIIGVFAFVSCKKVYTCVCTNFSDSTHDFYSIDNEKKKTAEQKCNDYYNATYASVPTNEVRCELKTK